MTALRFQTAESDHTSPASLQWFLLVSEEEENVNLKNVNLKKKKKKMIFYLKWDPKIEIIKNCANKVLNLKNGIVFSPKNGI